MKRNCWEVMKCGRSASCPASSERRLNGIHGGDNAGRACWVVAGTLCGGQMQGRYAQKMASCRSCEFYQSVHDEEIAEKKEGGQGFLMGAQLLAKLG